MLLVAGAAGAQDVVHERGEYRFWVGPEPAFVEQQSIPEAWDAKAPGNDGVPWRFWLFEQQVDRRARRDHRYVDYVYEARDATLLGDAGRFQITFNPGYQKLVIHRVDLRRDGRWTDRLAPERISLARREEDFEKDMADGNVTALLVLQDVRVHDVVRIRYSVIGSNPVLAGQLFEGHVFAWGSPVLRSRLRVLYDRGTTPRVGRENGAPEASIRETAEATEVLLESTRNGPRVDEGAYPAWYQPNPVARVSPAREWSDVVAWALPLYPRVDTALPADLEQKIASWKSLSEEGRLTAALRTVQDQVRYFGVEMGDSTHRPAAPADTWSRRFGDCKDKAYLLATVLERLGIAAVPALVSNDRGKGVAEFPPAASVFDHVIVRVRLGTEVVWVDPTQTSEGGSPRASDLRQLGVALPVAAGTRGLETIAPPADATGAIEIRERIEPAADGGTAKLMIETVYRGWQAHARRRSFAGARPEEVSRRYADYYRRRYGDLDVSAQADIRDDREANVLTVKEAYQLKSPFEEDGRIRVLELYADALQAPAQLPESIKRVGPLHVGLPSHYRHEVEVQLPERWTSTLGDEHSEVSSDAFAYERTVTVKARIVHVSHDLRTLAGEVPAAQVNTHLQQLRQVRDSLSSRLPFRPAGTQVNPDREARLKALLRNTMEGQTE